MVEATLEKADGSKEKRLFNSYVEMGVWIVENTPEYVRMWARPLKAGTKKEKQDDKDTVH